MSLNKEFAPARRLGMPGYPFAELERKAAALRAAGRPVFDLSIGDPDLPPPDYIVEAVRKALDEPAAHCYPSSRGDVQTRRSVARWFKNRFGVELDPASQVVILIGAKEGIAQLARAVVNPGEIVAYTEPGYPVYRRASCFMLDAIPRPISLKVESKFLPDLNAVDGAKLFYLNYPNNPTGAVAPGEFLKEVADLIVSDPSLTVAFDNAYSEMTFGEPSHSLLEFTDQAVEFHSLSKMANATGYRIGFAVGEPKRIAALVRTKEEMDSGAPLPFQRALEALLDRYEGSTPPFSLIETRRIYASRKARLAAAIHSAGHYLFESDAAFYLWYKVGEDETSYIARAVEEGLLATPGSSFGESGRGWVRLSATTSDNSIEGAAKILEKLT